jgi:hypothetical protein
MLNHSPELLRTCIRAEMRALYERQGDNYSPRRHQDQDDEPPVESQIPHSVYHLFEEGKESSLDSEDATPKEGEEDVLV